MLTILGEELQKIEYKAALSILYVREPMVHSINGTFSNVCHLFLGYPRKQNNVMATKNRIGALEPLRNW